MQFKINGYYLDNEQENIVLDNSKYLLVVAGAGSGKTLTILGKIGYLLKKGINPNEILCISFTNKASSSLKEKIVKEFYTDINVYTFHKLGLEILKDKNYEIADSNLLDDIINNFFYETILTNEKLMLLVLKYFNKKTNKNIKKEYLKYIYNNPKEIISLSKIISTFIRLFKSNNYDISYYKSLLNKLLLSKSNKIILLLSFNIYLLYTNYLEENNEIDFSDMLIKATNYVRNNGYNKELKYVIIDEYQDTSLVRFNLIKEILNSTNANLMVVGDDFQSIYRFTGCDINLFLNFKKYFSNSKVLKIENTYRNSKELIMVAGKFVMKNNKQIKKNLNSSKSILKPIEIIYYKDLNKVLNNLIKDTDNYIILGRNNNDINLLDDIYKNNFLTVHKSKGLEWDDVYIINLTNDILGFPSKIKNEKVLYYLISKELYPYSEERRLFYVALTRTKNKVYLLTKNDNSSIFINELLNNYKKYIDVRKE